MERDLKNKILGRVGLKTARTATNNARVGEIIDTQGFSSMMYSILIGTLADAGATFTVLLEHGDDAGLADAAAVPDNQLTGTEVDASFDQDDDDTVKSLGYTGDKRFVRMTITPAGNAANADFGAVAEMGNPHLSPVTGAI